MFSRVDSWINFILDFNYVTLLSYYPDHILFLSFSVLFKVSDLKLKKEAPDTAQNFSSFFNTRAKRNYMSNDEKVIVSKNIPLYLKQIICGLMLSDANIRMNGKNALMSIQQTHSELTREIWSICFKHKLILSGIKTISRVNRKKVYSFQTLSLPYFSSLYLEWYNVTVVGAGKRYKVLPLNMETYFTPLAFAYLIMGDGSWDKHGSRLVLHVNNFTLTEVKLLQSILLKKFNLESYLVKTIPSNEERGYIIKIPSKEKEKVRVLVSSFILPSLKYKLGM